MNGHRLVQRVRNVNDDGVACETSMVSSSRVREDDKSESSPLFASMSGPGYWPLTTSLRAGKKGQHRSGQIAIGAGERKKAERTSDGRLRAEQEMSKGGQESQREAATRRSETARRTAIGSAGVLGNLPPVLALLRRGVNVPFGRETEFF
jgi:hypothetical protein